MHKLFYAIGFCNIQPKPFIFEEYSAVNHITFTCINCLFA